MIHRPLEEYVLTLQIGVEPMTFLVTIPDALPTQLQETCRGAKGH